MDARMIPPTDGKVSTIVPGGERLATLPRLRGCRSFSVSASAYYCILVEASLVIPTVSSRSH